jgi:hypothetical protein
MAPASNNLNEPKPALGQFQKIPSRNPPLRLALGAVVNLLLLLMVPRLGVWSSDEREVRLALLAVALGTLGIVALFPIIKSGQNWQRMIGLILLVLPCLSFWFAFEFVWRNK